MNKVNTLNPLLTKVKTEIYDPLSFKISNFSNELEGTEYDACRFELEGKKIICRSSKLTPKKTGQFVTFWNRNPQGVTQPFSENDEFDFYVINVKSENHLGQLVFPKTELIDKGIISTAKKEGKRGFRVYPSWDTTENKQAQKTQNWQLNYFYEIHENTDLQKVNKLYQTS